MYLLSPKDIVLFTEYEDIKEMWSLVRVAFECSARKIPARLSNLPFILKYTAIRFLLHFFQTAVTKVTSDFSVGLFDS